MSDATLDPVIGGVTMVPKSGVTDAMINWSLDGKYFVSRDSDFNYGLMALDFFKPEFFAESGGTEQNQNFMNYWFGLNGFRAYPENGSQMITPVEWFKDDSLFGFSSYGVIVERPGLSASSFSWLLAAFAGAAVLALKAAKR